MSTLINAGRSTTVYAGQHQAGTCRMGNDPQGSVVNRNCQLHDVDNVFVIDSSVHVTNGGFNPALTIMAIAYFASACIGPQLEGYGIPLMKRFLKFAAIAVGSVALLAVGGILWRVVLLHIAIRPGLRKLSRNGLLRQRGSCSTPPDRELHGLP